MEQFFFVIQNYMTVLRIILHKFFLLFKHWYISRQKENIIWQFISRCYNVHAQHFNFLVKKCNMVLMGLGLHVIRLGLRNYLKECDDIQNRNFLSVSRSSLIFVELLSFTLNVLWVKEYQTVRKSSYQTTIAMLGHQSSSAFQTMPSSHFMKSTQLMIVQCKT